MSGFRWLIPIFFIVSPLVLVTYCFTGFRHDSLVAHGLLPAPAPEPPSAAEQLERPKEQEKWARYAELDRREAEEKAAAAIVCAELGDCPNDMTPYQARLAIEDARMEMCATRGRC